jgi:hypothetical protein
MSRGTRLTVKKPHTERGGLRLNESAMAFYHSINLPFDHMNFLQKAIGNQAVKRLLRAGVVQAQPNRGRSTTAWTADLLTVVVEGDQKDCFGTADPSGQITYGECGSPVRPPFCQSGHLPLEIHFYVDRFTKPRPRPFKSPGVSVKLEFVTGNGRRTHRTEYQDRSPRYVGPNEPLRPSFGHNFPFSTAESGTLRVQVELLDASGVKVTYSDSIEFIIRPCV